MTVTRPIRRVVTGHSAAGKSVFILDETCPHVYSLRPGSAVVTELWETTATPAHNRGADPCVIAFVLIDAEPV